MKKEQNLSSSVYELIKNKIINGEYMPGSVLMERSIAEEAGISRTPVREALKRLSQEGWIDWEERRRAIVSRITIEKILELFTLREMIEPFAIKKAIDDGRPQILAGQLAVVVADMEASKETPVDFMKQDMEFHSTIVRFMGMPNLNALWQKISEDMMRLVVQEIYPQREPDTIIGEHRRLVDALWNSDREVALACIEGHFSIIVDMFKAKKDELMRQ